MRRGILAAGVITALTPPCKDDARLGAPDTGAVEDADTALETAAKVVGADIGGDATTGACRGGDIYIFGLYKYLQ